jgi:phage gp16-like protein
MSTATTPHRRWTITPKQIALIHIAKKQLALTEDIYRAILAHKGGVTSADQLDKPGFNAVMAYLTACGFRSTWTQRTYGRRDGMASPRQIDLIRDLWHQWSDSKDDADLNRWLERSYGVSALRFLDSTAAAKAIAGLKAMVRRKQTAA